MNTPPAADRIIRDMLVCIVFYSRLPLSRFSAGEDDFAAAQWAAPIAGLVVGLCAGGIFALLAAAGVPAAVSAAFCLAATILLTGALHEDGAADTADGFGGGGTRERKLEIMRDSRIGTYGVLALGIALLVRWSAITTLAEPLAVVVALAAAHSASRALVPAFIRDVPPARSDGLSAAIGGIDAGVAAAAMAIGAAVLLAGGFLFALVGILLLAIWYTVLRALCLRQIGGQTGDVIGALQQGGEILILSLAAVVLD